MSPKKFEAELVKKMAACKTADDLNDQVISPFVRALEHVCGERGYVMNIFGDLSNLVIAPDGHADVIYQLVEDYLDDQAVGADQSRDGGA